ncbi:hypothetical protein WISP_125513 [Willisornis vidua]|uniref:Uncharacterized protein n=1 Tax=Willisornis vidua TaxID=1566151 RepID=A0ABQ9CU76_9PASS|nr:hypothetical protein WISP_125513 [Willisornis vidua]
MYWPASRGWQENKLEMSSEHPGVHVAKQRLPLAQTSAYATSAVCLDTVMILAGSQILLSLMLFDNQEKKEQGAYPLLPYHNKSHFLLELAEQIGTEDMSLPSLKIKQLRVGLLARKGVAVEEGVESWKGRLNATADIISRTAEVQLAVAALGKNW